LAGPLQGFADRHYDAVTATYLWLCERGKLRLSGCRLEPGMPAKRRDLRGT
jgi:hypothetical protein